MRAAFDLSYTALPGRGAAAVPAARPGARRPTSPPTAAAALAGDATAAGGAAAGPAGRRAPGRRSTPPAGSRFHDLLRLYAAERAEARGQRAGRGAARSARLFDWYLHTADAAARLLYPEKLRLPLPRARRPAARPGFADHAQALAWLDAERPNLVAAVQHAARARARPAAWLLADALRGYFWLRMYTVDWLAVAGAGAGRRRSRGRPARRRPPRS